MRKVTLLFLMLTLVLFLSACSGKDKTVSVFISGDTIPLRYADNLTLVSYPDYTIATLRNPWDTLKTLHTYISWFRHPNLYRRICPRGQLCVLRFANRSFIPRFIAVSWISWELQAV